MWGIDPSIPLLTYLQILEKLQFSSREKQTIA